MSKTKAPVAKAAAAKAPVAKAAAAKAPVAKAAAGSSVKMMSHVDHVLARPNIYIGSIEKDEYHTWVIEPDINRIIKKKVQIVPGLYKIYDELIVNVLDHVVRMKEKSGRPVKKISIEISKETGTISVMNDGDGIDILLHEEYQIYIPELIMGNLLTSTNYDDTEERVIGGQNGIGAKACNIFSKSFEIETVDGERELIYKQTFSDNMKQKTVPVIKSCKKVPYTKITFLPDYAAFKLPGLIDDMYDIMCKRAYDIAALTPNEVKVTFNGSKLECKNFETYADLYLGSKSEQKRIYEAVNDRWEIMISTSDTGSFEQISFVNGIWTVRGGKHVDYITNQVVKKITEVLQKKKKDLVIKPQAIRDNLMVFVRATIVNPSFDNQSKETLTTPLSSFGSKCEISDKFIASFLKGDVMDRFLAAGNNESEKLLKKSDGKKRDVLRGIPKLDDATWAGTAKSAECTLILTEGDSAKSLAISGLSVVGREKWGVFPLRGKILNVKDATDKKISDNEEITALKKILGLESRKTYENVSDLRYGHIMVMCDSDVDGFHIKGLLFNVFQSMWPSLVKQDGFMLSMLTPIVKASRTSPRTVIPFYTMTDYNNWYSIETDNGTRPLRGWEVKYYKGLGTSTDKEAKEYFREMKRIEYKWTGDASNESLDMAFNKKRADDRKEWIGAYDRQSVLDYNAREVTYEDFINKELIHFSVDNLERSIPSMCDGLKRTLRKILYCCFKRNLVKEVRVAQLAGYVSEHGAYHHGEASLQDAIINMAQTYVSANNINLLQPIGQFGTRLESGKDSASPRYIHTELNPITFAIYPKSDLSILEYTEDDGERVEPTHYLPVIPMALVNGISGIGTGFSTNLPAYNPLDLVKCIRVLLSNPSAPTEELPAISPWYHGFTGTIENDGRSGYTSRGIYTRESATILHITELPLYTWTSQYKEFLEELVQDTNNRTLRDFKSLYTARKVHFELEFYPGVLDGLLADIPKFESAFKLSSTRGLTTTNQNLYDSAGRIHLYESAHAVIRDYFDVRYAAYQKRKDAQLKALAEAVLYLDARVRFILEIIDGSLQVQNVKRADLEATLEKRGYPGPYDYLVRMPISSLTQEKKDELVAESHERQAELRALEKSTPAEMWNSDLDAFERAYEVYLKNRALEDADEDEPAKAVAKKKRAPAVKR